MLSIHHVIAQHEIFRQLHSNALTSDGVICIGVVCLPNHLSKWATIAPLNYLLPSTSIHILASMTSPTKVLLGPE